MIYNLVSSSLQLELSELFDILCYNFLFFPHTIILYINILGKTFNKYLEIKLDYD